MHLGSIGRVGALGRVLAAAAVVTISLGQLPGTVAAQDLERRVTVTAECRPSEEGAPAGIVSLRIANDSGVPLRIIAVLGIDTPQAFHPLLELKPARLEHLAGELAITIRDGKEGGGSWPWTERRAFEGEGYAGGAIVVTNLGVMTPLCTPNPADAGELVLTDPLPRTDQEQRQQEARYMAETLGRLESWRAYPLLYALLHPDAQEAVSFGQLTCWYVAQFGTPDQPNHQQIFATTVSVAEVEPWTWDVSGKEYETAISYDVTQEVGTIAETDTVSGNAHLVQEDGVWRWFFGTTQDAIDALPRTCGVT